MAYKYRCPYCGEKGLWFLERCGTWVSQRGYAQKYPGRFHCDECRRAPELFYGGAGRWLTVCVDFLLPVAVMMVGCVYAVNHTNQIFPLFALGFPTYLAVNGVWHLLFAHFDKQRKAQRDADARLTFAVSGKHAFVKKWNIYLIRFPKRGTNEYSPTLYAMVCSKEGARTERTYTLRVIRADNMELPAVGEAAWLVTDSQKVVEGTVTAITPKVTTD